MTIWIYSFLARARALKLKKAHQQIKRKPEQNDHVWEEVDVPEPAVKIYAQTRRMANKAAANRADESLQRKCRAAQLVCGITFEDLFPELIGRHFTLTMQGGKARIMLIGATVVTVPEHVDKKAA